MLKSVDLSVGKGEFVCIFGVSGSGKSTLLNILGLLDNHTGGTYLYEGRDVLRFNDREKARIRNKKMGFVFQSYHLIQELNALENIEVPLGYAGMQKNKRKTIARRLLEEFGIPELEKKYISQMSGGEQQRIAIARAVANSPELLFADEPTGSVKLVQHYPKEIPVILFSLSMRISDMTDRHSVRFSSRVSVS